MKEIGIYVHIPFCKQKCYYCDFVSFAKMEQFQDIYIKNLIKEIKSFKQTYKDFKISTIYIGGGTPSYIDAKYIKQILDTLTAGQDVASIKEITIEINPGTFIEEKLLEYKKAGINRISIGLQSADNKLLKEIGRIHNFEDFLASYKSARKIGFENINLDLMIGLPNQTISNIKGTLQEVINLSPNHISVYSLILEENTMLENLVERGILSLPEETLERNMYWYVKDFLELNGYEHYEISNFARHGFESKHNLDCWSQKEYIGFGIAAHSYLDGIRFSNTENLQGYIKNCENDCFDKNRTIHEKQTKLMQEKEFMLLGLRKIEGVLLQDFESKFSENPIFLFRNEINKLVEEKLIKVDLDRIALTHKGLDLANIVWEEFV